MKALKHRLQRALEEVRRCRRKGWRSFTGEDLNPKLAHLEEKLSNALGELNRRDGIDESKLHGLVRWVSDWIPDLDDPLLKALQDIEDLLKRKEAAN